MLRCRHRHQAQRTGDLADPMALDSQAIGKLPVMALCMRAGHPRRHSCTKARGDHWGSGGLTRVWLIRMS